MYRQKQTSNSVHNINMKLVIIRTEVVNFSCLKYVLVRIYFLRKLCKSFHLKVIHIIYKKKTKKEKSCVYFIGYIGY